MACLDPCSNPQPIRITQALWETIGRVVDSEKIFEYFEERYGRMWASGSLDNSHAKLRGYFILGLCITCYPKHVIPLELLTRNVYTTHHVAEGDVAEGDVVEGVKIMKVSVNQDQVDHFVNSVKDRLDEDGLENYLYGDIDGDLSVRTDSLLSMFTTLYILDGDWMLLSDVVSMIKYWEKFDVYRTGEDT
jgi:hypothetical protein